VRHFVADPTWNDVSIRRPESWANNRKRRDEAEIPDDVEAGNTTSASSSLARGLIAISTTH